MPPSAVSECVRGGREPYSHSWPRFPTLSTRRLLTSAREGTERVQKIHSLDYLKISVECIRFPGGFHEPSPS